LAIVNSLNENDQVSTKPGQLQPISKIELTEHLYGQDFDRDSNTLEVVVGRLRRKLSDGTIETVRGQGYRVPQPDAI
jgi:DNA-binding response OmpR family regulator